MARPAANYNPSKLDGGATSFVPLLYHNLGDLSRGFLHFFLRGSTRLLLRLSLRDTHLAMALPGLSP